MIALPLDRRSWGRGCALALALASALGGCASGPSRPTLSAAELAERAAMDTRRGEETFRRAITRLVERLARESAASPGHEPPVIDFLAISGGGDWGAFGAGFLVGWGDASDPSARRPEFDAVTGVSTGALLAPFAFVGSAKSCGCVETFYRNPRADWIRNRGPLFFLPFNPSFMTIPGLERDIRAAIDLEFIDEIAAESRKGRILAISATDLDLGRQRFWDLGAESEEALVRGDEDRVQRILLASAAIPAVFPPIEIDGSLYADGGVTANVFLRLDVRSPDALLPQWRRKHPDLPLPRCRYWIIINNQIEQIPKTVQATWPSVVTPSLTTAVRSATVAEVRWLAAQADYVNATWGTDIEVRVASIPNTWRPPVEGDFQRPTMESLASLGRQMGADPSSWEVWTTPRSSAPPAARAASPDHLVPE